MFLGRAILVSLFRPSNSQSTQKVSGRPVIIGLCVSDVFPLVEGSRRRWVRSRSHACSHDGTIAQRTRPGYGYTPFFFDAVVSATSPHSHHTAVWHVDCLAIPRLFSARYTNFRRLGLLPSHRPSRVTTLTSAPIQQLPSRRTSNGEQVRRRVTS
ncbi:hypothetical protein C8Q78DRAFT_208265 [Trametes maxima]|nr:hypothetical protein C8Q78DRAFT_208265 [Trametes maxima]